MSSPSIKKKSYDMYIWWKGVDLYSYFRKFNSDVDPFQMQLEQAIETIKSVKGQSSWVSHLISQEVDVILDFVQQKAYTSMDELHVGLEQLFVDMLDERLGLLPGTILKEINESTPEDLEKRVQEALVVHICDHGFGQRLYSNVYWRDLFVPKQAHYNFGLHDVVARSAMVQCFISDDTTGEAITIMKSVKKRLHRENNVIAKEVGVISGFTQRRAYASIEELHRDLEQLFVDVLSEGLVRLPGIILKEINESSPEDLEKRLKEALKVVSKIQQLEGLVQWSFPLGTTITSLATVASIIGDEG
ncbi:hypothetical protein Syun_008529 [Stephania yunnanensis]|uniref:Uncharacterized protein n=1 Tax=Stephania yunnanensis TaxID=152371 RepID=A0AAP0PQ36_9MAGN